MTLGLLAFLASAVFGHPLLVPEVFGVFMLALGLAAGLGAEPARPDGIGKWLVPGIAAFYAISLVWRLA